MEGATIINTLAFYKSNAEPVYDNEGRLVGSKGLKPDRLVAVAEKLNMTVQTELVGDQGGNTIDPFCPENHLQNVPKKCPEKLPESNGK